MSEDKYALPMTVNRSIGISDYYYPIEFSKTSMAKPDQHIKSRSKDESSIFIIVFNRARSWIEESRRKTIFITRSKVSVNTNMTTRLGATIEKSIGQPSISVDGWANKPITLKVPVNKISNSLKIPISCFCFFINHHKVLWDNITVVALTTNAVNHNWFYPLGEGSACFRLWSSRNKTARTAPISYSKIWAFTKESAEFKNSQDLLSDET